MWSADGVGRVVNPDLPRGLLTSSERVSAVNDVGLLQVATLPCVVVLGHRVQQASVIPHYVVASFPVMAINDVWSGFDCVQELFEEVPRLLPIPAID